MAAIDDFVKSIHALLYFFHLCCDIVLNWAETVTVITNDGRVLQGTLRGYDQTINIIVDDAVERVFSATAPVEQVPLGLYIVRGDNVAMIGEVDEAIEGQIDLDTLRGESLKPVVH